MLQRHYYYPFGMNFHLQNPVMDTPTENRYQYNGKELEKDLGINLYDYGARWYDAAVGRFTTTDPRATDYAFQSPYAYAVDNPVGLRDILGMGVETDYYNTKGELLLHTDDGSDNVVIVDDEKSKSFYSYLLLAQGRNGYSYDSKEFNFNLTRFVGNGISYDVNSVAVFYDASENDKEDLSILPDLYTDANGNSVNVAKEHAIRLKFRRSGFNRSGIVFAGGNIISGDNSRHISASKLLPLIGDYVAYAHTHPSDDKNLFYKGVPILPHGPSDFDYEYYAPKNGFYSIVVTKRRFVFFKSGDRDVFGGRKPGTTFSIPRQ